MPFVDPTEARNEGTKVISAKSADIAALTSLRGNEIHYFEEWIIALGEAPTIPSHAA